MSPSPQGNRLLAALSPAELSRLTPFLSPVTLEHKNILYLAGGFINDVYFPVSGVISAVILMGDGQSAETNFIGREGMTGHTTFLGAKRSAEQVYCQVCPSVCYKMPVSVFLAEMERGGALRDQVHAYARSVYAVSSYLTACNCLHSVDERCARWLLMCHDRLDSDEFPLTHEFLAVMLGVRRATVTVSAGHLASAGIIKCRYGRVTILDRQRLEEASCECYHAIRNLMDNPD
jgi:CRP-like cAMP-binding protein